MVNLLRLKFIIFIILLAEVTTSSTQARAKKLKKQPKNKTRPFCKRVRVPTNTLTGKLYSHNGHFIVPNAKIAPSTTLNTNHSAVFFEKESIGVGIVRLKNLSANRYLAINQRGRVIFKANADCECLFKMIDWGDQGFIWFASFLYYRKNEGDAFLAVNVGGRIRNASVTRPGQKSIRFLFIRPDDQT